MSRIGPTQTWYLCTYNRKHIPHTSGIALHTMSSSEDPASSELNQCFEIGDQHLSRLSSTIDKRVRNLDKRHTKLLTLENEFKQGKVLNEDQRTSLVKLPLIEGNIEMGKEIVGLIKEVSAEYAAEKAKCLAKKQNPKKERAVKPAVTENLCLFNAVLYSFAEIDKDHKTSSDYADLKLTEFDLKHLRTFISLTRINCIPSLHSVPPGLPLISKYFSLLLDSSKETYQGDLTYSKLHKLLLHLSSPHSLKLLDELNTKPVIETEEADTQTVMEAVSLPEVKPASTNTEKLLPHSPVQEPIPSQTILNQNAQDLSEEELLISSTDNSTEVPLIPTTVFLSKKSDLESEPVVAPSPPPQRITRSPDPVPAPAYPEEAPQPKSENILSFPGMNIPSIPLPAQTEEAFDFLHDSEISLGVANPQTQAKQYPNLPSQPQIPAALYDLSSFEANNPTTFLGSRLPDSSYKGRAAPTNNSSLFPARHSPTNPARQPAFPDVMPYQSAHFKAKEQPSQANIQQYLRSNPKEMAPLPQAPKTISNSTLAQPYGNMLVENSSGGSRQDTPWEK